MQANRFSLFFIWILSTWIIRNVNHCHRIKSTDPTLDEFNVGFSHIILMKYNFGFAQQNYHQLKNKLALALAKTNGKRHYNGWVPTRINIIPQLEQFNQNHLFANTTDNQKCKHWHKYRMGMLHAGLFANQANDHRIALPLGNRRHS